MLPEKVFCAYRQDKRQCLIMKIQELNSEQVTACLMNLLELSLSRELLSGPVAVEDFEGRKIIIAPAAA